VLKDSILVMNFHKMGLLAPSFAFFEENFTTKRKCFDNCSTVKNLG